MPKVVLRGDAVAKAKIYQVTFSNWEDGDKITASVGNKTIVYAASSEDDAASGLATLINASSIPEFQEFSASSDGAVLTVISVTAGKDVFMSFSTEDAASGTAVVTEVTPGVEPVNEVQRFKLQDGVSGGSFSWSNDFGSGTETSNAINWNDSAAAFKAAIVGGMASVTDADLSVVKAADGDWYVTWKGALAATEIGEGTIDGSSLTGTGEVDVQETQAGRGLSDEIQMLRIHSVVSSMSFRLIFAGTQQILFNTADFADAASLQAQLEAASAIGAGNVEVLGGHETITANDDYYTYFIRFKGDLAGTNLSEFVVDFASGGTVDVTTVITGGASAANEFQVVNLGKPLPDGNTWTLSDGTDETSDLTPNETAADIETDLEGFAAFDDVAVSGQNGVYGIEFKGTSVNTDIALLTLSAGLLSTTTTPSIDELRKGEAAVDQQWEIRVFGSGGSFTLTDGTDISSAIAFGALAATVKSTLETDITAITTVTVTGTGTPDDPYIVTVTDPSGTPLALTGNGSSLTGGDGIVTEETSHVVGVNEVQRVTITATTGQWKIADILGEAAGPWDYNETAANIKTDVEAVLGVGNIDVTGVAGGPYDFEFTGDNAEQPIAAIVTDDFTLDGGGSSTESVSVVVTQRSQGPAHANDPLNWNVVGGTDRVPETGDDLVIEDGDQDLLHGLNWLTEFTADAGSDQLTITDHDFADEQKVRVSSDDTLPAGLAADTDYYVIYVDHNTIQLSATRGGSAIDITDAGTGTHTIAVELNSYTRSSNYTGLIGLAVRNTDGETYYEYRNRAFRFGLLSTGDKKITVGTGDGSSSGREILHNGAYEIDMVLYKTGGSQSGEPAFQHTGQNANSLVTVYDADAGFAFHAGEVSQYKKIMQHGGFVNLGEGQTIAEYIRTDGETLANGATFTGTLTIVG